MTAIIQPEVKITDEELAARNAKYDGYFVANSSNAGGSGYPTDAAGEVLSHPASPRQGYAVYKAPGLAFGYDWANRGASKRISCLYHTPNEAFAEVDRILAEAEKSARRQIKAQEAAEQERIEREAEFRRERVEGCRKEIPEALRSDFDALEKIGMAVSDWRYSAEHFSVASSSILTFAEGRKPVISQKIACAFACEIAEAEHTTAYVTAGDFVRWYSGKWPEAQGRFNGLSDASGVASLALLDFTSIAGPLQEVLAAQISQALALFLESRQRPVLIVAPCTAEEFRRWYLPVDAYGKLIRRVTIPEKSSNDFLERCKRFSERR